ncbi:MAG: flavin-containing monooxygenase [Leucobacter sp.]
MSETSATSGIEYHETVIVGVGFSGIAMAHDLLQSGREDFVLLEKSDAIGGVWRDNTYPNAACDVQAHLYSLSFAQNPEWSSNYAGQTEIWAYQHRVIDDLGIGDRIRLDTGLVSARWVGEDEQWELSLSTVDRLRCRFLVSAIGSLNQPLIPKLEGFDDYRGEIVHTAEWHDGISMSGKRVAVIGAGASAIQVVPAAVDEAEAVFVSVRTAPHVMPKPEEFYGEEEKQFFREHPEELERRRRELYDYWNYSTHSQAVMDEAFLGEVEGVWQAHMESAIADPELRRILTPDSRFGCRRPVVSNHWYPALADPKTRVTPSGVVGLTERGVRTSDGEEWDADLVVLATGFRATDMLDSVEFRGADGRTLVETWVDGPEGVNATVVKGFPNLFIMTGPNYQASGSIIGVIEAQSAYVAKLMDLADEAGAAAVVVTDEAQAAFNDRLDEMMARTVWEAGGCHSFYRIGSTGRVAVKWPGSLAEFEEAVAQIDRNDYRLLGQAADDFR